MAKFKLEIDTDNAAFEYLNFELVRCLRDVADRIESGDSYDTFRDILDSNGNIVGRFALKPRLHFVKDALKPKQ